MKLRYTKTDDTIWKPYRIEISPEEGTWHEIGRVHRGFWELPRRPRWEWVSGNTTTYYDTLAELKADVSLWLWDRITGERRTADRLTDSVEIREVATNTRETVMCKGARR